MAPSLSILCFGNSLTAGFYQYGLQYHPYSEKLKERLKEAFPSHTIRIDVDGVPGDLVITPPGRFLTRMQDDCSKTSYDWVIVLGATNDLGRGYPCWKIFPALKEAWQVALDSGAQILALTVPECAAVNKRLDTARAELNSLILNHSDERFHAFDLHKHVPYHSSTENFRELIFDDGLHLTAEGYDLVGNVVADHLIPLLSSRDAGEQ
ncbi:hypothetical protein ASPVEDRAFT_152801 [Aspergillus versicolor CBS 583.65]|uniref:SGNH hydrolase-type esterase domain-containing protein n=1 Tax=Aspergillus versicolor CBS 583.65 TaxID=1036611 RepID=A0A1L9PSD2_ASPVE|nr:uncharacterized protein ASPVEDRAFT_152801 [Aspergillus versicolor CBS 583.65]OJJ04444.1 hypothetical protein ASPVEDRAFT_152801 [Aspergillus versicolor CBS 583.65]